MDKEKNIIDIEAYFKEGKTPEKGQSYRIRVDKDNYVVESESLSGREILKLAGKTPIENYALRQKLKGGVVEKIAYDQIVDFTTPGIERFITIPLDQTDGQ